MLFSDEFVASIKSDPTNGVLEICKMTLANLGGGSWSESDFNVLSEAFALLATMMIPSQPLPIQPLPFRFDATALQAAAAATR